jgi:hypothetical protein
VDSFADIDLQTWRHNPEEHRHLSRENLKYREADSLVISRQYFKEQNDILS